ncbi:2-iminoacetate synthase ThiH [Romboutsia weinsteinii]|uniref:2-iminoacetate synthase ThiH n=1 Tax=Romboutsia weinsteinii TaxID=2020949 RepID=A0A371J8F3_9FIRM|nr:2-iminoacetate synthase ThiH [Romboutsia weinsteinii]RDY29039.1 2-iminoacetate synthase ThiH [Romboutsia weinsteinii]
MSFYEIIDKYKNIDIDEYLENVSEEDVLKSIGKTKLDDYDLLNLLSKTAVKYLEQMAQKANRLTNQHFGKTISLYTPMYIANYCINKCAYCSYSIDSGIKRKKLNLEEVKKEGDCISQQGFKHLLILTGESKLHSSVEYIGEAVENLKDKFSSLSIEVYPMEVDEYTHIVEKGVDGLTIYQETYNEEIYKTVHIKGPKSNYKFRLDAPERGVKAGMRNVSIGALLGLSEFRKETFFTILHGSYLKRKYPHVDVCYSTPRIRPFKGCYEELIEISDTDLVQAIICMRLFDPHAGINISTREDLNMRRNLIPIGVTKLSASVSTDVGGHSQGEQDTAQFKTNEDSELKDVKDMLKSIGYQHIFKDWERL